MKKSLTIVQMNDSHAYIDLHQDLEINDSKVKVSAFKHGLITIRKEMQPDNEVQKIVERLKDRYYDQPGQALGTAKTALNRDTAFEATMDNFLLQAILITR